MAKKKTPDVVETGQEIVKQKTMFLSMNWIGDFVDLSGLDKKSLIKNFTLSTAEVEDIIEKGTDISGIVVAKILSVENHPDSKKLHLLKVDIYQHENIKQRIVLG